MSCILPLLLALTWTFSSIPFHSMLFRFVSLCSRPLYSAYTKFISHSNSTLSFTMLGFHYYGGVCIWCMALPVPPPRIPNTQHMNYYVFCSMAYLVNDVHSLDRSCSCSHSLGVCERLISMYSSPKMFDHRNENNDRARSTKMRPRRQRRRRW